MAEFKIPSDNIETTTSAGNLPSMTLASRLMKDLLTITISKTMLTAAKVRASSREK